jgi:hypothetical protein
VVAPVVVPVALCPVHPVLAPIMEHVVRKRVFKACIEDWEWDCFDKKEDPEPMRHLLLKYHGLHWLDGTDCMQVAKCDSLEWNKGRLNHGYHLIGVQIRALAVP